MAKALSNASLICYIAAAVFLLASIVLFIALRIPRVFSDYTGRTARRKISNLRARNESSGNKSYRPSKVNKERGKVTDSIPEGGQASASLPGTEIISENKATEYSEATTTLLESDTAKLAEETKLLMPTRKANIDLKIIDEIILVHTEEVVL